MLGKKIVELNLNYTGGKELMNYKFKFLKLTLLASLTFTLCQCSHQPSLSKGDDVSIKKISTRVEDNKSELSQNQIELDKLSKKIKEQQSNLYLINQKLDLLFNEYSDMTDNQQLNVEERVSELEKSNHKLLTTLNQIKKTNNNSINSAKEIYDQLSQTKTLEYSVDELYHVVMKIKGKPSYFKPFSYYTVKKGDSIEAISLRHQIDTEELKEFNSLSAPTLFVGQQVRIPKI
jgi:LysM repeat protein